MKVLDVIEMFDEFLNKEDFVFTGVIIGGAALNILKVTTRLTRDIDFLSPSLDEEILVLADKFRQLNLHEEWVNNGPIKLQDDLPKGWNSRLVKIFNGNALTLQTLGKLDLLKTKLYAYCDRDIDLQDCIDLAPTISELDGCVDWLVSRDANEHWPRRVTAQIDYLKERLSE